MTDFSVDVLARKWCDYCEAEGHLLASSDERKIYRLACTSCVSAAISEALEEAEKIAYHYVDPEAPQSQTPILQSVGYAGRKIAAAIRALREGR